MNSLDIDITNKIDRILDLMIDIMRWAWLKLESIELWGTNLLMVTITITIIMIVIPIIFTIVKSGTKTIGDTSREIYKRSKS